jgi:methyl-accepting chemotaxis protein
MLRRKLLIRLGILVGVLVIAAVGAIWLLQGVLSDLDHAGADPAARVAALSRLRFMVMGMSVAALVVVNLAVLLVLRTAEMILRPVDALVEASRELGLEHFDYRVQLDRNDEFGELARAYNSLAAQLAANEQRKMETLQQTSLMLSHEVNNILAIIAMQLALADRQAAGNTLLKQHLTQINASLSRMAETVAALGRVRRIVLTDYLPGQKMLDLPRSVAEEETETPA